MISWSAAAVAVLRPLGIAGKFAFVLVAVTLMDPTQFGRFGLISGASWIAVVFLGLNAHAIIMRDLVRAEKARALELRNTYIAFALVAALVGAAGTGFIAAVAGWSMKSATLSAAVIAAEYLTQELVRLLAADRSPLKSGLVVFCKSGSWCYALTLAFLVGLTSSPWTLDYVLTWWLAGDIAGLAFVVPYLRGWRLPSRTGRDYIIRAAYAARPLFLATLGGYILIYGGRFVVALTESEAASGRFTFLATLAFLSVVLAKGIAEPLFFAKVVGNHRRHHQRAFAGSVIALALLGTIGSVAGVLVYEFSGRGDLVRQELGTYLVLLLASFMLCLEIVPHFRLYAEGREREILSSTVLACGVFLLVSAVGSPYGLVGAALATLFGCATMLAAKAKSVQAPARGVDVAAGLT